MIDRLTLQPNQGLFCLFFALCLSCFQPNGIIAEETSFPSADSSVNQSETTPTAEDIALWIQELGSSDYQTRETATEKLSDAPPEFIPQLKAAAMQSDLEVSIRSIRILEAIFLRQSNAWFEMLIPEMPAPTLNRTPTFAENPARVRRLEQIAFYFDQIDLALSELGESTSASQSRRAREILDTQQSKREFKAMLDVLDLGGRLFYLSESGRGEDVKIVTKEMILEGRFHSENLGLQINRHWQNTPESLQKLKRITRLNSLYLIKGAPLSRQQITEVQAALPHVRLQTRGAARLGVTHRLSFNGPATGAVVGDVAIGSAADQAGILAGDIIIRLADKKISDFESLVRSLEDYEGGDVVEVDVIRGSDNGPNYDSSEGLLDKKEAEKEMQSVHKDEKLNLFVRTISVELSGW
ncbi:hypothetical protein Pla110_11010 [Polystyrenella longa]|uniref:PDZ domain-containing protein n=1 Tax=Polystyrenella longa TaxID=2528007 RepID=A0A518CJJ1_9PLAN|nr:PDZ domain-containing protein [Polystyrenella longa]QDU79393.1 hypothetical protein Pla110_11010 [Polystyrenella longa]